MTTQREVADAFFNGDSHPRSASNFRIVPISDDETQAYLVGGQNGADIVFAYREPINQYELYTGNVPMHESVMRFAHARRQRRKVKRAYRNIVGDIEQQEPAIPIWRIDELMETLSDRRIPAGHQR